MRSRFVMVLIAVAFFSPASLAEDPKPSTPEELQDLLEEGEPAYSLAQVQAWVDEVRTHVEEIAGRKFTKPPKIAVVTRTELESGLENDLTEQGKVLHPKKDEGELRGEAALAALSTGPMFWARYNFSADVLHLPATNVPALLRKLKPGDIPLESIMKVVIAHELTHALQAEHAALRNRLTAPKAPEAAAALSACIEGHGMEVQRRFAEKSGLEAAEKLVREAVLSKQSQVSGLSESLQYRLVQERNELLYVHGARFIRERWDAGGVEAVWALLNDPPASTKGIAPADRIAAAGAEDKPLDEVASQLAAQLKSKGWTSGTAKLDERRLTLKFRLMALPQARETIAHVKSCRMLFGQRAGGDSILTVTIARCDSSQRATEFLAAVRANNLKMVEVAAAMAQGQKPNTTSETLDDTVSAEVCSVKSPSRTGGESVTSFLTTSIGEFVVEVMAAERNPKDNPTKPVAIDVIKLLRQAQK